jgi:hypothetical protein
MTTHARVDFNIYEGIDDLREFRGPRDPPIPLDAAHSGSRLLAC